MAREDCVGETITASVRAYLLLPYAPTIRMMKNLLHTYSVMSRYNFLCKLCFNPILAIYGATPIHWIRAEKLRNDTSLSSWVSENNYVHLLRH